jgi:hypothetical protein
MAITAQILLQILDPKFAKAVIRTLPILGDHGGRVDSACFEIIAFVLWAKACREGATSAERVFLPPQSSPSTLHNAHVSFPIL